MKNGRHFVAYHNSDELGPFYSIGKRSAKKGERHSFFTAKPYLEKTLKGQQLWAFEGSTSREGKRYSLISSGVISGIRRRKRPRKFQSFGSEYCMEVYYRLEADQEPLDVTNLPWFRELLRQQQSFRNGFNPLKSTNIIRALRRLNSNGAKGGERKLPRTYYKEGARKQKLVDSYERDPAARRECLRRYGTDCFVCRRSLASQYGHEVDGLIHVHHLEPLAKLGRQHSVDPVRDLRPVCPNCHAVIHWTDPPRTVEQVRRALRTNAFFTAATARTPHRSAPR